MSAFGAKGKGKAKEKTSSPEGGKGHLLPKTRLSAEKFTGTVVNWKGKFGFIKPSEEIEHEKASLHGGNLFVGINDLEGVTELEQGATVEFHICEDDSGLGAEEVVVTEAAPAGGKSAAKGGAKGSWGASSWGGKTNGGWGGAGYAAEKGGKVGAKGWSLSTGAAVYSGAVPVSGSIGKQGKGMNDKGKGKEGKGKSKGGKGHLLPRTRISAEKFQGTCSAWKGKYGFITPAEPIEHEKASKHNGSLFVSKDDLEGVEELAVDTLVEFHIWEDSSGLGADEVAVVG